MYLQSVSWFLRNSLDDRAKYVESKCAEVMEPLSHTNWAVEPPLVHIHHIESRMLYPLFFIVFSNVIGYHQPNLSTNRTV